MTGIIDANADDDDSKCRIHVIDRYGEKSMSHESAPIDEVCGQRELNLQ
jgi:hypothetical protein